MDDYIAERLTRSTAARKDVLGAQEIALPAKAELVAHAFKTDSPAGTQAPPVDTSVLVADFLTDVTTFSMNIKKRGRPRTGFDKKQYDRDRMKRARSALKATSNPS